MTWKLVSAREYFDRYLEQWDEINRSNGDHILLDSRFVGPLVRNFGTEDTLLGVCEDRSCPGLVLLTRGRLGLWRTFQPSQAPLGLVVLGDRKNVLRQIRSLIRTLPGFAIALDILQQDPDHCVVASSELDGDSGYIEYVKTARVNITGTFEEYWSRRPSDLRSNIGRRFRRLSEQGVQCELSVERDAGHILEHMKDYGRMEESGWKGSEGTAVSVNNSQGLFYREILEWFCRQGEAVVYRLLLDGKPVAMQLCLERQGMLVSLKIAYDESAKNSSPGFLLQQEIIKRLFSEARIRRMEFYGRIREGWTLKWTDDVRAMYHVNCYRNHWCAQGGRALKASRKILGGVDVS